jgi:hypothetical protein
LKVAALERKLAVIDERKMEHMLQLKHIVMETEAFKVQKMEQTKILKNQSNHQEHKRKLRAIQLTAKTQQKGKDDDVKRHHCVKQKKFQGGSNQMGLLQRLLPQSWDNSNYQGKFTTVESLFSTTPLNFNYYPFIFNL